MTDPFNEAHDYGEDAAQPTTDDLARLSKLVDLQQTTAQAVEEAEVELKRRRATLRRIEENEIPLLMATVGMTKFTTASGLTVDVTSTYRASIAKDRRAAAIAWLDKHEHGAIVKRAVSVSFSKGEEEKAIELQNELVKQFGGHVERTGEVHPQTLKAWVKRMIESGTPFPRALFGAEEVRVARIKNK